MQSEFAKKFIAPLEPHIDADEIVQTIQSLAEIEKRTDFDSFEKASSFLLERFKEAGADAEILRFPCDGKSDLFAWKSPIGFRTREAFCEIRSSGGEIRRIADRRIEPNAAMIGTGYTGADGVQARVVEIRDKEDAKSADVSGKIAFASKMHPASIKAILIARGALGLISSFTDVKKDPENKVKWINNWSSESDGWLPTASSIEKNLPGISVSPAEGARISSLLSNGPVEAKIVVEGEYFQAEMPTVCARWKGESSSNAVLTGHMFEQGLMDNASGVGLSLCAAAVLKRLSKSGRLRYLRGLSHFHGQECYSALALSKFGLMDFSKSIGLLCLDMIGVDPSFQLMLKPGLMASSGISQFLIKKILRESGRTLGAECVFDDKFEINCTLLADPMVSNLPTSFLMQKNQDWHSSGDRAGVLALDKGTIDSAALFASAWSNFMVSAEDGDIRNLTGDYLDDMRSQIDSASIPDHEIFFEQAQKELRNLHSMASAKERKNLEKASSEAISAMKPEVSEWKKIRPVCEELELADAHRLRPKCLVGGTAEDRFFSAEILQKIGSPKWSLDQIVLKSWADGKLSVYEIARRATYERGISNIERFSVRRLLNLFSAYADAGLLKFNADTGRA